VTSDAFGEEKIRATQALGAQIISIPSDGKRITEAMIREVIDAAQRISPEPQHWWFDQMNTR